jgi:hypothetical protein
VGGTRHRLREVAGETDIKDEQATWRGYPEASAPGESDGTLALTKSRLTFPPTGTGVVFDADIDGFESAGISRERSGRSEGSPCADLSPAGQPHAATPERTSPDGQGTRRFCLTALDHRDSGRARPCLAPAAADDGPN